MTRPLHCSGGEIELEVVILGTGLYSQNVGFVEVPPTKLNGLGCSPAQILVKGDLDGLLGTANWQIEGVTLQ